MRKNFFPLRVAEHWNRLARVWIVRAWRSEDVVLYGKVGPPLLS